MKEWTDSAVRSMCVGCAHKEVIGKAGIYDYVYKMYDADHDTCTDVPEGVIKALLRRGGDSSNLYLSPKGEVRCTYVDIDKLQHNSMTAVGLVNGNRHTKDIKGYDMVTNTGEKRFVTVDEAKKLAFDEVICNMTSDGDSRPRFKASGQPLYVRYTDEQSLEELKQQLISILTEMDKIKPVQFHDIDCDNCVYNFSDVVVDTQDDRVYIEIAMWHDNLPAHAEHPLKDGRGREILPKKRS